MKRTLLTLALVAVVGLSACAQGAGSWTPQGAGRTAGEGTSTEWSPAGNAAGGADSSFNSSLRK